MSALANRRSSLFRQVEPLTFLFNLALLLGSWLLLYWAELLFTESHLAGYYCCVSESDLPVQGTIARTFSDFFATSPGKHLPSLVFVVANLSLLVVELQRVRGNFMLPLLFVTGNLLYPVASILAVSATWSISAVFAGHSISAYKGYNQTWYGIVGHFILWGLFFLLTIKVSRLTIEPNNH